MPIDYKNYPSNWKTEIRPAIIQRAKNCCEFCGILNYQVRRFLSNGDVETHNYFDTQNYKNANELKEHLNDFCDDGKGKWSVVVLTIAHLDNDTKNNDYSNLKALCQKCHNKYDVNFRKENRRNSRVKKLGLQTLFV